jgi:uncharacterized repeat protein (TIGR03803 family)
MKPCIRFFLSVLITALGLIAAGRGTAQTFTTLHCFTVLNSATNSDGARPTAGLIVSGNTMYGTAVYGGIWGNGTVFAINTDGSGFTNLHSFTPRTTNSSLVFTNNDGAYPYGGLVLSGNTLYGTAVYGGTSGHGTAFAFSTDGTSFTNLHNFTDITAHFNTNSEGANPYAGLILSGDTLYGTATNGGSGGVGTVFAVKTNAMGFKNLHNFIPKINSDGAYPNGELILSVNTLYGTTRQGGLSGWGAVFALSTDGTSFTNLHSFTSLNQNTGTNTDGVLPTAGLILSADTLYGTASGGGSSGKGTVFALKTDGTGFRNLHSFTYDSGLGNSDGANPNAGLLLSGGTLYGTAFMGGASDNGTVFAVSTDGTRFTTLYHFTGGNDGAAPRAGLVLSGNTLYGTTWGGGSSGNGTVFSIFIQPQLTIIPSGPYVILTWPTNYTAFTLQSTTNLVSLLWNTNYPAPVVVNGQNTVTNPISGRQKFYRLSQ